MSDLFPDTLDDLIAEAERELQMRLYVYPRRVAGRQMRQDVADMQIRRQRGIVAQLKADKLERLGGTG